MFIENDEDESKQNPTNQVNVGSGGGSPSIGGASNTAFGNPSTISPTTTTQPQKFASATDYLKANQQQGENLGNQFSQNLTSSLNQEKGAIDTAANKTKNDIELGTVAFDPSLVETINKNPTQITNDPNQMTNFLNKYNATYSGPSSFENSTNYTPAATAINEAIQNSQLVKDTGGRKTLLQNQYGVTGEGNKSLDQGILQGSSYFPTINEQGKNFAGVQDYLKSKSADIGTQAQNATDITNATKTKTQNALTGENGAINKFKSDIAAQVTAKQAVAAKQSQDIQDAIAKGNYLTDDQIKALGLTKEQFQTLEDKAFQASRDVPGENIKSIKNYLTTQNPSAQITQENVASPEDFANAAALAKLSGQNSLLDQTATTKAGTAPTNLTNLDYQKSLQHYLDEINAGQEKRKLTADQIAAENAANEAQHNADRTAQREQTQNLVRGALLAPEMGVAAFTNPVQNAVKSVAKSISKAFCFDGNTLIDMPDRTQKPIKYIKLGDQIKSGKVISIRKAITEDGTRYNYRGVIVTGSHAVKENKWIRVEDSQFSKPIKGEGIVYSLVTTSHKISINNIIFADEHETDLYETLTLNESLKFLNKIEENTYESQHL